MNLGKLNSYFGEGTVLKGALRFKGVLRFDGDFEGDIQSDDTFIVGETGKVKADIKTGSLYNFGGIKGDVDAASKISLHAGSSLMGNIKTPILATEETAHFEGSCVMPAGSRQGDTTESIVKKSDVSAPIPVMDSATLESMMDSGGSSGGGFLKIILLLIVIIAAAAAGWFVFGAHQPGQPPAENTIIKETPSPDAEPGKDEKTSKAEGQSEAVAVVEPPKLPEPPARPKDEQLREQIASEPQNTHLRVELAKFYLDNRDVRTAISVLEEAAGVFQRDADIRALLASAMLRAGREKEAMKNYMLAGQINPGSVEAVNNTGFQKIDSGSLQAAAEIFNKALETDSGNLRAMLGLAFVYSKQEENDKAITQCQNILKNMDDFAPALNRIAWTYAKQNVKLQEAKTLSEKSLAYYDNIPEYIDTLSEVNFRLGDYDSAIRLITRAISLVPTDPYYKRQLFKFQKASRG